MFFDIPTRSCRQRQHKSFITRMYDIQNEQRIMRKSSASNAGTKDSCQGTTELALKRKPVSLSTSALVWQVQTGKSGLGKSARGVSFSEQVQVFHIPHYSQFTKEDKANAFKSARGVSFSEQVQVFHIPHYLQFTKEDKANAFYSKHELDNMRSQVSQLSVDR